MKTTYLKGALTLVAAAGLVGSSGATATAESAGDEENAERPVVGTANASDAPIELDAQINGIDRASTGGLTSLTYTIVNNDTEESDMITHFLTEGEHDDGAQMMNGPALLDEENDVRYFSVSAGESCVCPHGAGSGIPKKVPGGEAQPVWDTFMLPDDVTTVTVEIPGFENVEGVEVA